MLITQAQALRQLKDATGLTEEERVAAVRLMPKRWSGKRQKVHIHHVRLAISKANEIPQIQVTGVRGISSSHRQQLGGR